MEGGEAEEEKEKESEFKSVPNSEEEEGKPLRAWAHGFLWPYVLERNFLKSGMTYTHDQGTRSENYCGETKETTISC